MKNDFKKGKLILGSFIFPINLKETPSLVIEEKTDVDGTKQLTGKSKWNTFKFSIVGENNTEVKYGLFDSAFIIYNNNTHVWKLSKCKINLDFNEIIFDNCEYYNERMKIF